MPLGTLWHEQESPSMSGADVTSNTFRVLEEVAKERERQDYRWGVQSHGPQTWLAILVEEVGEVAKTIAEGWGGGDWDTNEYRKELIQTAAVALAAVEALDNGAAGVGRAPQPAPEPEPEPRLCSRILIGWGDSDTFDPICGLPTGHTGMCKPAEDG